MSIKAAPQRQAGLTIIELILFIVIMGVALGGVLAVMSRSSLHSAEPIPRKQAILRAEAVLEEVALAHFTFCHPSADNAETANSTPECTNLPENFGPRPGEGRPFLNVNDYVSGAGVAAAVTTDAGGAPLQPAGYPTTVTIRPVAGFGPAGRQIGTVPAPLSANSDVLHISVAVQYSGGTVTLDRYRTRYAPNSLP